MSIDLAAILASVRAKSAAKKPKLAPVGQRDLGSILANIEGEREAIGDAAKWRIAFMHKVIEVKTEEEKEAWRRLGAGWDVKVGSRFPVLAYGFEITDGVNTHGDQGLQFGFEKAVPDLWSLLCQPTRGLSIKSCSTCEWGVPYSGFKEAIGDFGPTIREPTYVETLNARVLCGGRFIDSRPFPDHVWSKWRLLSYRKSG